VLDVGTDYAGCVFGAECEGLALVAFGAAAIFPGVHLLGDDVSFFANATGEELGGFEDGGADFAEAVPGEDGAGGGFDVVPKRGLRREEVPGAAYCFQNGH
jgi:hypothetical protein